MKKFYLLMILLCAGMNVVLAQIAAPTLNSPADGYVYPSTIKPNLKINSVSGASYYMFHWSEDPTFSTYDSYTMSSSYTGLNVNRLKFGTTYYWRVYAITANYADTSASSAVWSFTTTDAPTLTGPTDGIVLTNSVRPNIRWTELVGASKYIYQCDTSSSFDSPLCLTYTYNGYNSNGSNPNQLHFGKTYYLRMKATNTDESDTSAWSAVRTFTTTDAPTLSSPSNGTVYSNTIKPTLSWNSVTGASKYIYQCDTTPTFDSPIAETNTTTSTSVEKQRLRFNATYYWRVCATNTNNSDTSAWSGMRHFTTCGAPTLNSPSDGYVNTSAVKQSVSWNSVTGASRYILAWDTVPTFDSPIARTYSTTSTSISLTPLKFNTTYYWRVCATNTNESDTSAWSDMRHFTTCGAPTLSSPSDGVVYTANVGPTVNWNTITGASHYILVWDTASTFDSPLYDTYTTTGTSVNIWPIKFATTYYWRVCATNSNDSDTSAWSAAWTFTTSDAPILTSPSDGYVYPNSVTPTLQCTAITRVGKYIYQWDTTATFNSPMCASTTKTSNSTSIGPLKLGTTYYWRMRATNYNDDSDTSSWSTVWSFTTGGSIPTLASPSNGATAIRLRPTLDWNAVSSCDYYDYECDTTPQFNSPELQSGAIAAGTSEVRLNQLRYGTTYYWRVRIRLNSDTSSWSTVWSFTTAGTIALTSPANGTTLYRYLHPTLDWDFINDGDYYEYQYDLSPDFDSPELVSGLVAVGTSEIDITTPVRFGATYYWRVREYTSIDTTPWSATWSFTTPGEIALVSPANGSTLSRTLHPTLDWDYINGGDTYEYQYDLSPDFDSPELVTGQRAVGTSEIDISTPLRFGATYYWRVRETTSIDTTPWSETWSFTTPGEVVLVSPANGTTNVGSSTTLDWDYIRGGTIYEYQYDVTPDFNSAELVEGSIQVGTSQVTISNLEENRLYYWRVRELSAVDTTPWSEVWHFSTRMQPIFTDVYDTACDSYTWNGQTYTQSGEYTRQFVTALQADSTVTLHLTIYQSVTSTSSVTVCESDLPYHYVNGDIDTIFEVGTPNLSVFNFQFSTSHGCDSTVILTLNIRSANHTEFAETACGNYTWNGEVYEESGDYVQTFTNAAGCDSVVTLHLTIFTADYADFADSACGSYTWNDEVYTESGDYVQTFTNVNGCDSVVTLHLTILTANYADFADNACGSYTWNDEVYTESGDYVQTFTNVNGCDSVVTLHLTVYQPETELVELTLCESDLPYHYVNGDIDTTFEVGTPNLSVFNFQFSTSHGCDSMVTLHLTIFTADYADFADNACGSYTWNDEVYEESGDYVQTFTNANGCDSVVTLHLTILTANYADFADSACGSYTWNGEVYEESGDYVQTFTNANGCDSVVTLHLTIYQPATETIESTICESDLPYHYVNGDIDTIFEVGTPNLSVFNFQFSTSHGCDSTVTLTLTIEPCDTNGINENGMANLTLYPNPTTGMVNVQFTMNNEQWENVEIQVFDVYGRLLRTVETCHGASLQTTQIDLSQYTPGVYLVRVVNGGKVVAVRKVVKE